MQTEAHIPLTIPDASLRRPSVWENRLLWFPLIGWAIAGFMQFSRILRATRLVELQLKKRDCFPVEAWNLEGHAAKLAEDIARAIVARLPWPNHYFIPADPIEILLLDGEGMGFIEAAYAIEKEFGVKIGSRSIPLDGSFSDLVKCVCLRLADA